MNKLLEDFEQLKNYSACFQCQYHIDKECTNEGGCIWKELEKELKANEIAIDFMDNIANEFDEHDLDELTDKIVKTKKALKIIDDKEVNVAWLTYVDSVDLYNKGKFIGSYLTEEEFDLLKEVLL